MLLRPRRDAQEAARPAPARGRGVDAPASRRVRRGSEREDVSGRQRTPPAASEAGRDVGRPAAEDSRDVDSAADAEVPAGAGNRTPEDETAAGAHSRRAPRRDYFPVERRRERGPGQRDERLVLEEELRADERRLEGRRALVVAEEEVPETERVRVGGAARQARRAHRGRGARGPGRSSGARARGRGSPRPLCEEVEVVLRDRDEPDRVAGQEKRRALAARVEERRPASAPRVSSRRASRAGRAPSGLPRSRRFRPAPAGAARGDAASPGGTGVRGDRRSRARSRGTRRGRTLPRGVRRPLRASSPAPRATSARSGPFSPS